MRADQEWDLVHQIPVDGAPYQVVLTCTKSQRRNVHRQGHHEGGPRARPRGPTDVELSLETKRLLAHGSRDIERLPVGIENRYLERVRPVRLFPGHLDNAADREGRGSGPGVSPAYSQRMEHIALYLGEVSEQQSQFHEARAGVSDWSEGIRVVVAGASCKARRPTLLGGVK